VANSGQACSLLYPIEKAMFDTICCSFMVTKKGLFYLVKNPVDEGGGVFVAVSFGDFDGFVD
jgi:hypothetical protein